MIGEAPDSKALKDPVGCPGAIAYAVVPGGASVIRLCSVSDRPTVLRCLLRGLWLLISQQIRRPVRWDQLRRNLDTCGVKA